MNLIFKISDSIKVIFKTKRNVFSFFKKGSSIASTQILHSVKLHVGNVNTIIDVGANQGQFALASTHFFPSAFIFSFEPVPETFEQLSKNISLVKNIKAFNIALGNLEGKIDFFSNEYSHASSALAVSGFQKEVFTKTHKEHKIKVVVKKLDNMYNEVEFKEPVLLKLDVQGFEKEVLKGAQNILDRIDYLLFEASFIKMYDGEPLFDEMHTYVKELGFELIAPVSTLQSKNLQILQMDMLYRRKNK